MFELKPNHILLLILFAIPNTVLNFGIIYIINNVIGGNEEFLKDYMIIVFLSIVFYTYLLNIIFQKNLNKYVFKVLYENEKNLFDQILKTPLLTLEKFGTQRFYTAMEDLRIFSNLPYAITTSISSTLMLLLGIAYMCTLSITSAIIVVALILLVALRYLLVIKSMSNQLVILRKLNEYYYSYVDDLISGFKELKLSSVRKKNIMKDYLEPNRDESESIDFNVNYIFLSVNLVSQYGLYFVVAAIMFVLPALGLLERFDVIAYVVVLLFISGPINNLINLQQMFTRFRVADRRIKIFMKDFEVNQPPPDSETIVYSPFESLRFSSICFAYGNDTKEKSFELGPIDLEIKRGEVLFVIGGNGSGKSTFINLLTGLYEPTAGKIVLNNSKNKVAKENLQNSMTAIFTDNHVFSRNYDDYKLQDNTEYHELLKTMKLDEVVNDDKDESARRKFSKGQSKRMSMIFMLLENKPILVLDEWAADQDPHFRKYFYEELIPLLKQKGKTIIAVTHDDNYFHVADRIIKFDYGKILTDLSPEKLVLKASSFLN